MEDGQRRHKNSGGSLTVVTKSSGRRRHQRWRLPSMLRIESLAAELMMMIAVIDDCY
jgi:hypothetical protein